MHRWNKWLSWGVGLLVAIVLGLLVGEYLLHWNITAAWELTGVVQRDRHGQWIARKTVWDLLQLLIFPLALAGIGIWFNTRQKSTELEVARKSREADQQIAENRQQDAVLDNYLGKMSDLLLEKDLRKSDKDAELRKVARAWTLTALPRLDGYRKRRVVQFLFESGLIDVGDPIMDLRGADLFWANLGMADLSRAHLSRAFLIGADLSRAHLSRAHLTGANLTEANLTGATLTEANLIGAFLIGADLSRANLSRADLTGADLTGADLTEARVNKEQLKSTEALEAAVMPDGSRFTTWGDWERRKSQQTEAEQATSEHSDKNEAGEPQRGRPT